MSRNNWRNNPPIPDDYETEEDFEEAMHSYDSAIDNEIEREKERRFSRREMNK